MAKASRHYRAAKREVEYKPAASKGVFIRNDLKSKLAMGALLAGVILFIKGLIIGYLFAQRED